jgi:hypothetical protein
MVTYRQLFRVREFRFLYGAQALSYLGDQFAAISVVVLVLDRTGSGFMAAVAYASGWLISPARGRASRGLLQRPGHDWRGYLCVTDSASPAAA